MKDPPQNADDRELHDLLIAISVVSRHLARKVEEASALQRGSCFPCYSRPDLQAKGEAEPEHGDRKNAKPERGENP